MIYSEIKSPAGDPTRIYFTDCDVQARINYSRVAGRRWKARRPREFIFVPGITELWIIFVRACPSFEISQTRARSARYEHSSHCTQLRSLRVTLCHSYVQICRNGRTRPSAAMNIPVLLAGSSGKCARARALRVSNGVVTVPDDRRRG